jgi:hypothetical protein
MEGRKGKEKGERVMTVKFLEKHIIEGKDIISPSVERKENHNIFVVYLVSK